MVNKLGINQGRVVRKPANANPGLKVNQSNSFSSTEAFFTAYVLCSLTDYSSSKLKDKQYKQENLTENVQN